MGWFHTTDHTSFGSSNTFDQQKKKKKTTGKGSEEIDLQNNVLSRYKIAKKVLGSGGFGKVFKATAEFIFKVLFFTLLKSSIYSFGINYMYLLHRPKLKVCNQSNQ